MSVFHIVITVLFSVVIGLFMGIIGGGGGGIYVVVMMFVFHQNAKTAAMTALILSTATLCGAAVQYLKKKQLRSDYFAVLSILDIIGTLLGAVILNLINENILKIIIFCVLVLSGLSSFIKINSKNSEIASVSKKIYITAPVGMISGLVTGTTGLSAGTMLSSLLIGLLDFPPYLALGTTTLVSFAGNLISIAILFISGFWLHSSVMHMTDMKILITFGVGSAAGALFGAKLTPKINRKVMTIVLGLMAIAPGVYLAIKK